MYIFIYLVFGSFLLPSTKYFNLYSPEITLPPIGAEESLHFGYYLYADMPDSDGDGDDYLEDYYSISLLDITASYWHSTDIDPGGAQGYNFWCADKNAGGYSDKWIQFLDTPIISIGNGGEFSAKIYYSLESPEEADAEVEDSCTDGWDAANIRISTDGGNTWELLKDPTNPYHFICGYGWIENDAEYETGGSLHHLAEGWGGNADWHNVSFDLSKYSGQDVIIRFAFGSDPEWSTIDESAITGFRVDDINVSDNSGNLYLNNGNDDYTVQFSGEAWDDQFYDYCDTDRPGYKVWEEYPRGAPFNVGDNTQLQIDDYAEKIVKFRIQTRYDDNHDGGKGKGLFIDDFMIYKLSKSLPIPWGLSAKSENENIVLEWFDFNESGVYTFIYWNGVFDYFIEIDSAWVGEIYQVAGTSTVNSISLYNINDFDTTITIGAFEKSGNLFNNTPSYDTSVVVTTGANVISVIGWEMNNNFIIGHEFGGRFVASLDTTAIKGFSKIKLTNKWEDWKDIGIANNLPDGEWAMDANITLAGADVTYNVYRDESKIVSGLIESTFPDSDVENNVTYKYTVSATFSDEKESDESEPVTVTLLATSVLEESHDDGSFESDFSAGYGNFSAVRYTADSNGEDIVRFKWFQRGSGGSLYIKIFEDNGGMPGDEIYSKLKPSGNIDGWNEQDLSSEDINVTGDFWVGTKEFSTSQPFGLDTSSNSGNSYQRSGSNGDWTQIEGNLGYHVYLDCGENCDENAGRVQSSLDDLDTQGIPQPIYTLKWENKKLKRVSLKINGQQLYRIDEKLDVLNRLSRTEEDTIILLEYNFESSNTGWSGDAGWEISNIESHNSVYSFNSPNRAICAIVDTGAVWPGNTNSDNIVDVDDILPIGKYWNKIACERSMSTYGIYDWESQQLRENINNCIAHADANGDGNVNIADILVIMVNWNKQPIHTDTAPYISYDECNVQEEEAFSYYSNFSQIYYSLSGKTDSEIQMRSRLEELFGFSSTPYIYQIYQNYPNPFNPSTLIPYYLPKKSEVILSVFDLMGREVIKKGAYIIPQGSHEIIINGQNLSSGVYFYQFTINGNEFIPKKMILLK